VNRTFIKKNVIVFLISLFCLSCGLEDDPYLGYIFEFARTDNISANARLPSTGDQGYSAYFSHFEIYYRIYISDLAVSSIIEGSLLSQINSSLNSDFSGLRYLTDKTSTSANPSNLETVFSNRRYFKLTLEGANIDDVLDSSSLGGNLEIRFPGNAMPVLSLNGVSYTLQRANSGPSINFSPKPNRNFLNYPELYNTANVTNEINADVAAPNTNTPPTPRYTYVSMYIFSIGKDYITTIYSQPTYINIFRLAEEL
jgi:hypothetical protein